MSMRVEKHLTNKNTFIVNGKIPKSINQFYLTERRSAVSSPLLKQGVSAAQI
ncbi:MAG: hypothetical protein IK062_00405 [Selenomonadaceae bacterium]|nr:hypothetical protein [Selenomonadaceae bacterium]